MDIELDLAQMQVDPYPTYARLRREQPVGYAPQLGLWMATRWSGVAAIAGERETWGSPIGLRRLDRTFGEPNILTADDEEHLSLRAGLDQMLRPRAVASYIDDLVRPLAQHLAASLGEAGGGELVTEYLEPLSVLALGELLGLGDLDDETLRRWFKELQRGSGNTAGDPAGFAASDAVVAEIEVHVDPILDRLKAAPDGSLLSHMLFPLGAGTAPRPREEIYPSYMITISGGMREPTHAGATTMLGLLSNPEQLHQVVADPRWLPRAIVEGLRWIAPIAQVVRSPRDDVNLEGSAIPAGALVQAVVASANRDEKKFDHPTEFDIARSPNAHMSFGQGAHFCAGNYFARQLLRIGLEELLAAMPRVHLDPNAGEPEVRGFMFRAPTALQVRA